MNKHMNKATISVSRAAFWVLGLIVASSTQAQAQDVEICKNRGKEPIPPGYVIIAQSGKHDCPGEHPNSWIIHKVSNKPGETIEVCKVSPIPEGYVRTGESGKHACPGEHPNSWIIQRLPK
jgi:hypothetical protein